MTSTSPKPRKSASKGRKSSKKKAAKAKVNPIPPLSKTPPSFRNCVVDKKSLKPSIELAPPEWNPNNK